MKIVVVSHREPWLLDLLQAGTIQLAIVPRTQPLSDKETKRLSTLDWFQLNYEVLRSGKETP